MDKLNDFIKLFNPDDTRYEKLRDEQIDKAADFMDNLLDGPKETEAAMLPQIQTPLFV